MAQLVHDFETGSMDQKDLLGGKGANLAEMTRLGIPVPPGFTITTDACRAYLASRHRARPSSSPRSTSTSSGSRPGWAARSATATTRCWCRCAPARSSRCPG